MYQFNNFEIETGTTRAARLRRQAIIQNYVEFMKHPESSGILTPSNYTKRAGKRFEFFRSRIHHSQYDYSLLFNSSQSKVSRMEVGSMGITLENLYTLKYYTPSFDPRAILGKELLSGDALYEQFIFLKAILNDHGIDSLKRHMDMLQNTDIFLIEDYINQRSAYEG